MADDNNDIPDLNHDLSVATLHHILTESKANSTSGDVRIAGDARRDFLFAAIILKLLGATDKQTFDSASYPDLPTPEALQAASVDASNPVTGVVPEAAPAPATPAAPSQPQSADALAEQSSGTVTAPSDVTNETVTGVDSGKVAADVTGNNTQPNPATPDLANTDNVDTDTSATQLTPSDLNANPDNKGNNG